MYDAILISPHYNYARDSQPIPGQNTAEVQDLSMIIPLGVLHLAQYLHDKGLRVRLVHLPQEFYAMRRLGLVDASFSNLLITILKNYPARICGIQAHFYLYCGGAAHVAARYKKLFPDSTVVVGGYMATACWKDFLMMPGIDGVVLGEGEKTFLRIIEKATQPGNDFLSAIDGVATLTENGEAVLRPPHTDRLMPLDTMPLIAPQANPFANLVWPQRSFINISRGLCPESCAYCVANNRTINPRRFQFMQIDRILAQLHLYQDHGIHSVFLGENHFLDTAFMKTLIAAIIDEKLNLTFELETHPALFEGQNLLPKMVAAGFHRYTMGCESGSDALLKRMGRRSTGEQILAGVRRIAEAGGLAVTSWICNLPGETEADCAATAEMLDRVVAAGGFVYWIENLHVLPGSRLFANPTHWRIAILLKRLADWIRWAQISKTYVEPEEALADPLRYLTHCNHDTPPREMLRRFFSLRRQARDLVPEMKTNLAERSSGLPHALHKAEWRRLEGYAAKGWKLLLF
jgi:radical SAM superfamily enzyme YgiQ (UPF0313 family)